MTTRLYPNNAAAGVTPSSWLGGWSSTSGTTTEELGGHTSTADVSVAKAGTGTAGQFNAVGRFVSRPLKAQTIDGTFSGVIRGTQANATDDYTLAVGIKVIKSDGTDRGTLLSVVASDNPATYELGTRRVFRDVSENSSITLSSLAVSDNDRIVVEVGFLQGSTSVNSATIYLSENSRDDGIADLPFSDDANFLPADVPWVEFSNDIKFQEPFFLRALSIPEDVAADNGGTNSTSPTTFTQLQLAPARQGDLIVADQHTRSNTAPAISNAAGQSWTSEAEQNIGTTNYRVRNWCTFDGTWDADLSLTTTDTVANSCQVLIFRAEEATDTWEQDVAQAETEDTTSPFAATAVTTVADEVIVLCSWATPDNNTWSAVTGSGWIDIGSAQYRNLASQDMSDTYAYYWAPTGGTGTGSPSKTQLTLGADDTMCLTQAWKRIAADNNKTLTVDGTSYAFTAGAVSIERGRLITAEGASYAFTAGAVSMERGYEILVDPVSYAFTAGAVTLEHDYIVTIESVTYAFTPADVGLSKGKTLVVEGTSYTFAADDVSLEHGREILVDATSYAFTADAVSLERGYEIAVDSVTYAFTANEVSLNRGKSLLVDSASYNFTVEDISLERGYEIAVEAVNYSFTANDVSIERGYEIAVDSVAYAFTANDVSIEYGREIVVDTTAYAFTPTDVSLERGYEILADSVAYAFTPTDVTITQSGANKVIAVDNASYAFTTNDVSLERGYEIAVETVSYLFSLVDISLERGFEVLAEGVTYTFGAEDVSLERGREIAADSVAYVFNATDVTITITGANKVIAVDGTSYAFTADDVSLEIGREVVADSVAYAFTADDVSIEHGRTLIVEGVTYNFTAANVSLERGREVVVGAASYAFTAANVDLTVTAAVGGMKAFVIVV
jgi:hypothetical protein